jgi:hypothetical protein
MKLFGWFKGKDQKVSKDKVVSELAKMSFLRLGELREASGGFAGESKYKITSYKVDCDNCHISRFCSIIPASDNGQCPTCKTFIGSDSPLIKKIYLCGNCLDNFMEDYWYSESGPVGESGCLPGGISTYNFLKVKIGGKK